jgi:hypothetical protein
MRVNDSKYFQPIMSIIAHADPATFKAMQSADWPVTVVDGAKDLIPVALTTDLGYALMLEQNLAVANGVTIVLAPDTTPGEAAAIKAKIGNNPTYINRPYIAIAAEDLGVPAEQFAASTMVHEFHHHNGEQAEPPAYDAAAEFARKMGVPELVIRNEDMSAQKRAEAAEQHCGY